MSLRQSEQDVAIVGAGPAGSWAAYLLARGGARVTLFDASHPREKPCGGGVTGRALEVVAGSSARASTPAVRIETARFECDGAEPAQVPLFSDGAASREPLIVASRTAFDRALLDAATAAGAVHVRERVRDVEAGPAGVLVRTASGRHAAGWLLGADGANSLVRRRFAAPFERHQLSIATGFMAHGVTSREIVVKFVEDPPGYIWSFPRPDHLAIGVCAQAERARTGALKQLVAAWLSASVLAPGASLEPYAWPIPTLSVRDCRRERPAIGRAMLLGDAAGLVDPLTREGIYFALRSAEFAADALLHPVRDSASHYARAVHDEIFSELLRAARLKAGFFRARFTRLLVDALRRSEEVREVMADLVAGQQLYRGLKRRLLHTFELGLAWQLLLLRFRGHP